MENPYQLETPSNIVTADRLRIATLINDLVRAMEVLTADIEHGEEQTRASKMSGPMYPVLAGSLQQRKENLRATIGSLEAFLQGKPKVP